MFLNFLAQKIVCNYSLSSLTRNKILEKLKHPIFQNFCTTSKSTIKVSICNANGKVGAPLALLLQLSKLIDEIALYDTSAGCCELGLSLSYINLDNKVKCYTDRRMMRNALTGSDIVLYTPLDFTVMSSIDMFLLNSKMIEEICEAYVEVCHDATLVMCINPINSIVPFTCEMLKSKGHINCQKVLGLNSLDALRCSAMASQIKGLNTLDLKIPVIGGTSSKTVVPLLSHSKPQTEFTQEESLNLANALRLSKNEIQVDDNGISTAYAAAYFTSALVRAMKGEENIEECCFMATNDYIDVGYMAAPVRLGRKGFEKVLVLPLNSLEQDLLEKSKTCLKRDIARGISWANEKINNNSHCCD